MGDITCTAAPYRGWHETVQLCQCRRHNCAELHNHGLLLGDAPWSGYIPITDTYDNGTVYNTSAHGYNNGSWYVIPNIPARACLPKYVCA